MGPSWTYNYESHIRKSCLKGSKTGLAAAGLYEGAFPFYSCDPMHWDLNHKTPNRIMRVVIDFSQIGFKICRMIKTKSSFSQKSTLHRPLLISQCCVSHTFFVSTKVCFGLYWDPKIFYLMKGIDSTIYVLLQAVYYRWYICSTKFRYQHKVQIYSITKNSSDFSRLMTNQKILSPKI